MFRRVSGEPAGRQISRQLGACVVVVVVALTDNSLDDRVEAGVPRLLVEAATQLSRQHVTQGSLHCLSTAKHHNYHNACSNVPGPSRERGRGEDGVSPRPRCGS